MKVFKATVEICVTGIRQYGYEFQESDTGKKLLFAPDTRNQFDRNAVKVFLDGNQIGWIKQTETASFKMFGKLNVRKWEVTAATTGYVVVQVRMV